MRFLAAINFAESAFAEPGLAGPPHAEPALGETGIAEPAPAEPDLGVLGLDLAIGGKAPCVALVIDSSKAFHRAFSFVNLYICS